MTSLDWTADLQPLETCGVLAALPPLNPLREAIDAAFRTAEQQPSPTPSTSSTSLSPASPSVTTHVFPAQQLYAAILQCVKDQPAVAPSDHAAAALLIASVVMEAYVKTHSTRARLIAAHAARAAQARNSQSEPLAGSNGSSPTAASLSSPNSPTSDPSSGGGDGPSSSNSPELSDPAAAELFAFLASATPQQVADRLLIVFKEPDTLRPQLINVVQQHDVPGLITILKSTLQAHTEGDTARADGTGKRTLGGIFFREAKKLKAEKQRLPQVAALPTLELLRDYQTNVVGMVLDSWGLPLTQQVLARAGPGPALARLRFASLAGGWRGNWLVSAPTNSGKTRMFLEVARGVIQGQPPGRAALVLVLVPNVLLTWQHAKYFERAGLPPGTATSAHSSENPLTQRAWQLAANGAVTGRGASVMVATADSFANLLRSEVASLSQLDLLILDEAHHCQGDHPYAQVMEAYRPPAPGSDRNTQAPKPRVLAVTASPASEKDMFALHIRMQALLDRLGATLHVVSPDDPCVKAVVPDPKQKEVLLELRGVDLQMMAAIQSFAINLTGKLNDSLRATDVQGSQVQKERQDLVEDLENKICQVLSMSDSTSMVIRLDPVGQWLSRGLEFAARYRCPHLGLVCRLLDILRKAIELVEDAGIEGTLPFLARKAATLVREELAISSASAANGLNVASLPPCPAPTSFRNRMLSCVQPAAPPPPQAAGGGGGGGGGVPATAKNGVAVGAPALMGRLAAAANELPAPMEVIARVEAVRAAAAGGGVALEDNSCCDISLRASQQVKQLVVGPGSLVAVEATVRECFASGELQQANTFPKFWALMEYLQRYRDRETFHGIIFVRTRQAVFHVSDMIRRTKQLDFIDVLELIGHNSSAGKRTALAPAADRHGRGMSDSEQQQVLRLFKSPGCKVLVATSAAEEGLDVPTCEFVVRYNAAATGIQLLQSRGRARQQAAEFFAILQKGTLDTSLHEKSRLEEANMMAYTQEFMARRPS